MRLFKLSNVYMMNIMQINYSLLFGVYNFVTCYINILVQFQVTPSHSPADSDVPDFCRVCLTHLTHVQTWECIMYFYTMSSIYLYEEHILLQVVKSKTSLFYTIVRTNIKSWN